MGDSLDDLLGLNRDATRGGSRPAGTAPVPGPGGGAAGGSGLPAAVWGSGGGWRPADGGAGEEGSGGSAPGGDAGVPGDGSGGELRLLPLDVIVPSRRQPRTRFDEQELDELAASVAALGVLQPVLVRHIDGRRYELVAGERRWRAAKRAGLREIPAVVRAVGERESLEQAVVENLQRSDLNPLEEAVAYRQLIEEFELTQEDVALRVGKSRSVITNTLRLLTLAPAVQGLVRTGELSAGHARALLGLEQPAVQAAMAARVIKEGLSVRQVEQLVRAAQEAGRSAGDEARRSGSARPASVLEIERLLADRLDTRVNVSVSGAGGRGRVVIEFADLDDLDRVYQALVDPGATADW